ncbi:MAG: hypothetical protein Q7R57_01255 [Dehalococcoidales bacterium]|nr:hypothetical protein [Dehalococcoidales bacterium]
MTHREGRDYLVWAKQQINQRLVSVRGLSHVLYTEARAQAIKENKNIGQWINEAINEKLHNTTSN